MREHCYENAFNCYKTLLSLYSFKSTELVFARGLVLKQKQKQLANGLLPKTQLGE